MQTQTGCIVVEADLSGATSIGIAVGSLLPVQFVTESGTALPMVTGTVVARLPLPGPAEPAAGPPGVRLEILLHLRDLARSADD